MKPALAAVAVIVSLWSAPGAALTQCQQLNVIVRNQVWEIRGLNAFCSEFEQLKSEVQTLKRNLAASQRENDVLRARLDARILAGPEKKPAGR